MHISIHPWQVCICNGIHIWYWIPMLSTKSSIIGVCVQVCVWVAVIKTRPHFSSRPCAAASQCPLEQQCVSNRRADGGNIEHKPWSARPTKRNQHSISPFNSHSRRRIKPLWMWMHSQYSFQIVSKGVPLLQAWAYNSWTIRGQKLTNPSQLTSPAYWMVGCSNGPPLGDHLNI